MCSAEKLHLNIAITIVIIDRNPHTIVVNKIPNMTDFVLRKNVLEFNSECFLQTSGTAVGIKLLRQHCHVNIWTLFNNRFIKLAISVVSLYRWHPFHLDIQRRQI